MTAAATASARVIGISKDLKRSPKSVIIDGKKYVIMRTAKGVSMLNSVCPHRGATLCNGKVNHEANTITCPYHGWEFDSNGTLMSVPSSSHIPLRSDIQAYNVIEDGGFIWACNKNDVLPTKYCDQLRDPSWGKVYGSKDLEGSLENWIMNLCDISHINFVHQFGNSQDSSITDHRIEDHGEYIDCFAKVQGEATSILTEHMQPKNGTSMHSRFVVPLTSIVHIHLDGYQFITFSSLRSIDDSHTHMSWCALYMKSPLIDNAIARHILERSIYDVVAEDERVVKDIHNVPLMLNTAADTFQLKAMKKAYIMLKTS